MMALLRSTLGFHPLMVPSKVAKINNAGPNFPFSEITKSAVGFATIPVGRPIGARGWLAGGTVTTRGMMLPDPSKSVATPAKASLTQNGLAGKYVSPQGLTRFAS